MTETMIERVASAIVKDLDADNVPFAEEASLRYARMAIEAMREPTEAMMGACDAAYPDASVKQAYRSWHVMIDAALAE
jgi:hypothetical protein